MLSPNTWWSHLSAYKPSQAQPLYRSTPVGKCKLLYFPFRCLVFFPKPWQLGREAEPRGPGSCSYTTRISTFPHSNLQTRGPSSIFASLVFLCPHRMWNLGRDFSHKNSLSSSYWPIQQDWTCTWLRSNVPTPCLTSSSSSSSAVLSFQKTHPLDGSADKANRGRIFKVQGKMKAIYKNKVKCQSKHNS